MDLYAAFFSLPCNIIGDKLCRTWVAICYPSGETFQNFIEKSFHDVYSVLKPYADVLR